jgi:hypothetical protein
MGPARQSQPSGREVVFDFRPIPPAVAKDMHTLECPPAGAASEALDVPAYARRATKVLGEIQDAVHDDMGVDGGVTALGVSEERNTVTGAHGLILRRLMRNGSYSAPLGEIFSDSGRLDLGGRPRFDSFRYDAYRYGLELWIHQAIAGEQLIRTAFAIKSEGGEQAEVLVPRAPFRHALRGRPVAQPVSRDCLRPPELSRDRSGHRSPPRSANLAPICGL